MNAQHRLVAALAGVLIVVAVGLTFSRRDGASSASPAQATTTTTAAVTVELAPAPAKDEAASWKSPAAGVYRYHYSRTGDDPADYDAAMTVAPGSARAAYTEARDHQTVRITRAYAAAEGLQERSFSLTGLGADANTTTCAWNKPITVVPADPKPQQKWTSKASCNMTTAKGPARLRHESEATVHGFVEADLGGTKVRLLRIDRRITLRTTSGGDTGTRVSTVIDYFDLPRGLLAQSIAVAKDTSATGTLNYRVVESLLTTQPEVPKK